MDIDVDLRLAWLFTRELTVQSRLALRAFDDLVHLGGYQAPVMDPRAGLDLETFPTEFDRAFQEAESKREPAFLLVHSFLTHVSNVSKILWPPRPHRTHRFSRESRNDRAEALRRILGVPNSSVLEARDFRDTLEHFDERLETWSESEDGKRLDLWDMNQFPFGVAGLRAPTSETASLRILKCQPIRFAFLGSEVDLEAMADALVLLHDATLLWQTQAASAGVSRQITQREPVEMYLQRPDSDSKAQQQFDDACDFLRDLGISQGWTDAALNKLSAFVERRGWS